VDTSPYVTGITLLVRKEGIRRPVGGVPSTLCSVVKPLRVVLTADVTPDVQNGEERSRNRHRRRAMMLILYLVLTGF